MSGTTTLAVWGSLERRTPLWGGDGEVRFAILIKAAGEPYGISNKRVLGDVNNLYWKQVYSININEGREYDTSRNPNPAPTRDTGCMSHHIGLSRSPTCLETRSAA